MSECVSEHVGGWMFLQNPSQRSESVCECDSVHKHIGRYACVSNYFQCFFFLNVIVPACVAFSVIFIIISPTNVIRAD